MSTFVLFSCLLSLFFGAAFPAFLAPITTDLPSKKYMLRIYLKAPPQPANLLLDLSASFSTLVYCSHSHYSSYGSTSCKARSASPGPVCSSDSLSMPVTDGRNPGQLGVIPGFVFACGKRSLLKGLVKGAAGLAGLGRWPVLLSSRIDLSKFLNYTPLLSNPAASLSTVKKYSSPSNEYFIGLTAIKVNGKAVEFNQTLLSIDEKGFGGTKLSTVTPYTSLHSTIYRALTEAFVNESAALNLTVTQPVKPFKVCYNADEVMTTGVGPAVPTVDFVLQDDDVIWRVFGWNSMVRIFRDGVDVYCLGFLDGGPHPRSSIVIGGHQMDDNLLQFDLESNRLGFSSSLLVHGTMCANFNFTTNNNLR
ncbi:UNVERIFIED_CONTAM: putative aspartic proteinase GIP1 [Sesamum radiatum]|uniref:Aspartic proteinase GIP1 n=1 Tax=Sesamum radiatum TaxID=300843 RepID=A0AAW2W6D1_SESRA